VLSFSKIGAVVEENEDVTFTPPDFGVTVLGCSHGFDPKGSTSGYIFWVNGRGIMVDPPPFASYHMKQKGIPSILICAVIISHCHADHDAGTFHKILDDTKVEIITTRTIMMSFLRKYSAISGMDSSNLRKLFTFRPVIIGTALNIYGAEFEFFYSMHTIPTIGFTVSLEHKSIYFSGDTFYDPV
jgi:ribonuclease BN (tRNA processing enzyme)